MTTQPMFSGCGFSAVSGSRDFGLAYWRRHDSEFDALLRAVDKQLAEARERMARRRGR